MINSPRTSPPDHAAIARLVEQIDGLDRKIAAAQTLAVRLHADASVEAALANARDDISYVLRQLKRQAPVLSSQSSARSGELSVEDRRARSSSKPKLAMSIKQVSCPHCGSLVHPEHLDSHIAQKHSGPYLGKASREKAGRRRKGGTQGRTSTPPASFGQSFLDPNDGGRSLSESRRENGRFGSLPLYDSFDDESNA